jgi:hypothetical protein
VERLFMAHRHMGREFLKQDLPYGHNKNGGMSF